MTKWLPDGTGSRARIGVLTPHMDPVPETEFQTLAPDGVSIHSARVPLGMVGPNGEIIPHVGAEIAKAFVAPPHIDDATSLLAAVAPKVIVVAFTSSSYILGRQGDTALMARLKHRTQSIPVVVQSRALIIALNALGARRIALIHPPWFSDELDHLGAVYFREAGFDVLEHGQAKILDDYGEMPPQQIFDWVTTHTPEQADVTVIGGGGFRAISAINEIERNLKRPVLTANQSAFWLALRLSGVDDAVPGYGRIFGVGAVDIGGPLQS